MAKNNPTGAPHGIKTPAGIAQAKRERFLAALAETCNVSASCKAAGVDFSSMYRLRRRDEAFAARWQEAVEVGYLRIESELMRHALGDPAPAEAGAVGGEPAPAEAGAVGGEPAPVGADGEAGIKPAARPFNPDLAFKVLTFRARADPQGRRSGVRLKQPDPADALAALDRKLTAMEKRLERKR